MRVHEDYGMQVDDKNVMAGNYEIKSGYELMKEFLKSETPTDAVFVTNYEMTAGAVMTLNEMTVKIPDSDPEFIYGRF